MDSRMTERVTPGGVVIPEGPDLALLAGNLMLQGFVQAEGLIYPRLLTSAFGLDGVGKTDLAMSGPKPLVYVGTDVGTEGVIEKHIKKFPGQIFVKEMGLRLPPDASDNTIKDMAQAVWAQEELAIRTAIQSGARTVVVDAADEVYEHLVLARFGKLSEIPSQYWSIPQNEYVNLMRSALDSKCTNLILLHKVKKSYTGKNWNGGWERKGYPYTHNLAQVEIEMTKTLPTIEDPVKKFYATIKKCRHSTFLEGIQLQIHDQYRGFQQIASMVMPEVPVEMWV